MGFRDFRILFSPTYGARRVRLFESAVHVCQQLWSSPWYEKKAAKSELVPWTDR